MTDLNNTAVLDECRVLVTKRMRSSITRAMNEFDDALLALAFNKQAAENEKVSFDTIREIHFKKEEIKTRFERRYITLFNENLNAIGNTGSQAGHLDEKTVLDYHSTGEVEKTIDKIRSDCHESLLSLDRKVSVLLDQIKLDGQNNPVKPESVFVAFQDACSDIGTGEEIRKLLFQIFNKHAVRELPGIYVELDGMLTSRMSVTKPDLNEEKQKEQAVIMVRYRVMSELEKQVRGCETPAFVRTFLFKNWRLLLEKIYQDSGSDSPIWQKSLETARDLVLSVQIIRTEEEKKKLNWMLPSLIFRLRNGMRMASVPIIEKTVFLNKLKNYHLEILNEKLEPDKSNDPAAAGSDAMDDLIQVPGNTQEKEETTQPFFKELSVDEKQLGDKADK